MVDWDLIEPVKKDSYRFRVESLRCWAAAYKPIHQLQKVLDQIQSSANCLYAQGEAAHKKPVKS